MRACIHLHELYTVSQKTSPFYISNNSVKNEPILIVFGVQNPQEISHQKKTRSPHLNNVAALPCENNKSDAACRIVDHTHNTSTGTCQSHPIITVEDYYNFDLLNIADKTRSRNGRYGYLFRYVQVE